MELQPCPCIHVEPHTPVAYYHVDHARKKVMAQCEVCAPANQLPAPLQVCCKCGEWYQGNTCQCFTCPICSTHVDRFHDVERCAARALNTLGTPSSLMLVTAHLLAQTQEPARVSLAAISHPDLLAEAMPYLSVQVLSDDPAIAVTVTQHGCYVFAVPLAAGQWSYLYLEIVSDSQPQLVPLLKQSELYRLHPTKQLVFHLSYVSLQNESECNQCGAHSDHPEDNPCAGFCSTAPESLALGAMVHPFTTQMSLVQSVITDPLRVNYLAPGNSFLYMEWLRVGITILKTPPAQPPVSSHLTRIAIGHANAISTLLKGPSGILGWCSFRLSHTHLVCTHCMQRYPSIRAFIAHIIPGISASILFRYAIYHIDKTMTRNPSDVERFMLEQKF